jgi:hypothetical protein
VPGVVFGCRAHIDEGFDFLGHHIRRMRKRGTQKYYVYTKPSKKAIQSIKDTVKARTYRATRHMDLDQLILSLNRSLRGWANYFRHGSSKVNTVQLRVCAVWFGYASYWLEKAVSDRRLSDLVAVGLLTRVFPANVVDEVIAGAGRTQVRHRALPTRVMAYFSIGMALHSEGSY